MKVALLGVGKTGGAIEKSLKENNHDCETYSQKNPLKTEPKCDALVVFLTPQVFQTYLPLLKSFQLPIIIGTTGVDLSPEEMADLEKNGQRWLMASNFSLGMNLIRHLVPPLAHGTTLLKASTIKIEETHHTQKKDSPSGTALKWKEWFQKINPLEIEMISHRKGDEVGEHRLLIETPYEEIELRHKSKDRALFAQGVLWALSQLSHLNPGLTDFHELIFQRLK